MERIRIGCIAIAPMHARLIPNLPGDSGRERPKPVFDGVITLSAIIRIIKKDHIHVVETGQIDGAAVQHIPHDVADETGADPAIGKAEALLDASHPWQDAVRTARADLMARIASPKQRGEPEFRRSLTQVLNELKAKYQDAYLTAHERARLGANDDKRKAKDAGFDHHFTKPADPDALEALIAACGAERPPRDRSRNHRGC